MKSWNVRDQTQEALETLLTKKYNEIEMELIRREYSDGTVS